MVNRERNVKNLLFACLAVGWTGLATANPVLLITNLPPYGSASPVGGVAIGSDPNQNAIALFIYVPGAGWWSKPACAQPLTPLGSDGSWSADITMGGSDKTASRVAALLVSTNYNEECIQGSGSLPTNVFARGLASAVVTRATPGKRWLSFSGYDWWVKAGTGALGPGPNYFSDSNSNVWLDASGQLHLKITNRSNQWQCAELVSARTFGLGNYRFELNSRVDNLDPNLVLGLFTWSDDPVYANREIDVECSRFGNPADPTCAQFVVQPYNLPGHLTRYSVPVALTNSTHLFIWESNRIRFESQRNGYSANPIAGNVISTWDYSLSTPQPGDENVRLNFWLMNGLPPTNGREAEIVIKSFQFAPLGASAPASLTNSALFQSGAFYFQLETQPDRRYEVQETSNLRDWITVDTILATNTVADFSEYFSGGQNRFFRAITLP